MCGRGTDTTYSVPLEISPRTAYFEIYSPPPDHELRNIWSRGGLIVSNYIVPPWKRLSPKTVYSNYIMKYAVPTDHSSRNTHVYCLGDCSFWNTVPVEVTRVFRKSRVVRTATKRGKKEKKYFSTIIFQTTVCRLVYGVFCMFNYMEAVQRFATKLCVKSWIDYQGRLNIDVFIN